MVDAEALLDALGRRGVRMWLEDGRLRSRAPRDAITPELAERVRAARPALIEHLRVLAPIEAGPPDAPAPLSSAQKRLWFLHRFTGDGGAHYAMPFAFRLRGPIDAERLRRSLQAVVARHPACRTVFAQADDGEHTVQRARPAGRFELPVEAVDAITDEGQITDAVRRRFRAEATRPFDLTDDLLLRAALLVAPGPDALLLLTTHHIVSDAWSIGVVMRDLATIYTALAAGHPPELPPLSIAYTDYARWQQAALAAPAHRARRARWRDRLAGAPPLLDLPADRPRPPHRDLRGAAVHQTLPPALLDGLRALAAEAGATLFMALLAAFDVLLARSTGATDIVVGTPIANRPRPAFEPLVGVFVNTLCLRVDLSGDPRFDELLARVREVALDAYRDQDVPFEEVVEAVDPARSPSHHPLHQVMFALQNVPLGAIALPDATLSICEMDAVSAKFDLHLSMIERDGALHGVWVYPVDLFDRTTIERMSRHFARLLEAIVAEPTTPIGRLPMLTADARRLMVDGWNQTERRWPGEPSLYTLFRERARQTPHAVAVSSTRSLVDPGGDPVVRLSYGALLDRADALARWLRARGVGPAGPPVGVCLDRSVEVAVALLGVLGAGAAYLPLDPGFPPARLDYMIGDADVRVVLTQRALAAALPDGPFERVEIDTRWPQIADAPPAPPLTDVGADPLAYVMYTSGSSGRPKGVRIGHRSVVNFLRAMAEAPGLTARDVLVAVTTISFDISVLELFLPWLVGAEVVIAERDDAADGRRLAALLDARRATALQATPATWRLLVESGWRGRPGLKMLCGGEALTAELARRLAPLGGALWNMYGPTETTVWSAVHRVDPDALADGVVPIGRPIANTRLYVLDPHGEPSPPGVAGELYIGGDGLAHGYHRRPGETARRFVPDPFGAGRVYRTGDGCRARPDGVIEFLGRLDGQVKVNGFRIELGEVDGCLDQHPDLAQVAAVVQGGVDDARLIAFVVPRPSALIDPSQLRAFAGQTLPDYMIPTAFVTLDDLPRTPNGKVDRQALARRPLAELTHERPYVAPRDPLEGALCAIWAEVLGAERVGVHDDFFTLGGHSLISTRVVSRVRAKLGVELPLRALFTHPTVAGLAPRVALAPPAAELTLAPRAHRGPAPLSFAQQRLWFLDRLEGGGATYNMPLATRLVGRLDVDALRAALDGLVARHSILRTVIEERAGEPTQRVRPSTACPLDVLDLADHAATDAAVRAFAARPFDLSTDPMLRALLIRRGDGQRDAVLALVMHHIASDGWSVGIIVDELTELYTAHLERRAHVLPPLPIEYADFAAWQRRWLDGPRLEHHLAYWRDRLAGAPALIELPTDRVRPATQTFAGGLVTRPMPDGLRADVEALAHARGATAFMVTLAAFDVLLARSTGQTDIVVGTTLANRTRAEVEPLVGFFVNALPLRTSLAGEPTFAELIERVRDTTLDAYRHQELPFERLVDALDVPRDLSHPPIFQVVFTLQNAPAVEVELPGLAMEPYPVDTPTAKFDLTVLLAEDDGRLVARWEYARDLFDPATVERFAAQFEALLRAGVADPGAAISALPMLDADRGWLRTGPPPPPFVPVHHRFAAQARRTPDAPAVTAAAGALTYAELDARSDRLAGHLRALGVGPEVVVAICLGRDLDLLPALLAVWKAGGAWLPLDPTLPRARLRFMADDADAALIIADAAGRRRLGPVTRPLVDPRPTPDPDPRADRPGPFTLDATRLAYVLYTSGSTGRPKGSLIEHGALANYIGWAIEAYRVEGDAPVHSSIGFDATLTSLLSPLMVGGCVDLVPDALDVDGLAARLAAGRPYSLIKITPAHLDLLALRVDDLAALRADAFVIGGDALYSAPLAPFREALPHARIINEYGPTECVVGCSVHVVGDGDPPGAVPIGEPIAGARLLVLDERLGPAPVGAVGELYIGGVGVGRGYIGRPDLTAERFVPDPTGGGRLYRTGDRVVRRADGALLFVGRVDAQLKLRGYRIEPAEIEAALCRQPDIREAVVALTGAGDDRALTAYVTLRSPDAALEAARVADWQRIYARTYRERDVTDQTLDLAGWNSSFTGQAIDVGEMQTWVRQTVDAIDALRPRDVLEVGCGTGLIVSRVAPRCRRYLAVDASAEAVAKVRRLAEDTPALRHVEAAHLRADQLGALDGGQFDLVVLNSVIQYFPSRRYLVDTLREAARVLRPGGRVFVGDVRDHRLLGAFHAVVEWHLAPGELTADDLAARLARRRLDEEELLVAPDLFTALPRIIPELRGVQLSLQRGRSHNELTCFRYQVVLETRAPPATEATPTTLDGPDLDALRDRLTRERPALLIARALPNARLSLAHGVLDWVADRSAEPLDERRRAPRPDAGVEPEALWDLGAAAGYHVHLTWSETGPAGTIDARFRRGDVDAPGWRAARLSPATTLDGSSNAPMLGAIARDGAPRWRAALAEQIPDYMVPARFVALPQWPLTANGKIDRAALPPPPRRVDAGGPTLPRDAVERRLIELWEDVLGLDAVGIDDDFFALGGHSLAAVKLMARVQQVFGVDLPLSVLFRSPTIAALARRVQAGPAPEDRGSAVCIQPHGQGTPFWCLPGAGGHVTYLYWLARHLGRRRPFYGLEAVGLDGETPPHTSIEAAAAAHVAEIRRVQPTGPYLLGAHSFGGKVAFEIAQQLMRAGQAVELLALFDAGPPDEARDAWIGLDDIEFMVSLVGAVGELTGHPPTVDRAALEPLSHEARLRTVKGALEAMGILPPDTALTRVRGLLDVFRVNEQTVYTPTDTRPLPITFFAATEQPAAKRQGFVDGWSRYGPVEVHPVPGSHIGLLAEPHVRLLATRLGQIIDQRAPAHPEAIPQPRPQPPEVQP